jgi:hypothetical protein
MPNVKTGHLMADIEKVLSVTALRLTIPGQGEDKCQRSTVSS